MPSSQPDSYADKFYELFPYYLAIGMTYEQYWEMDCNLVKYYRQADEFRQERTNQQLWLQGAYVYEAICNVSPILHAYAKKGTKPIPYPSEPFSVTKKQQERKEETKEKKTFDKGLAFMQKFLNDTNKKLKGGEQDV